MRKYKFTLKNIDSYESLKFPSFCPGCLSKNSNSNLDLVQTAGLPFVVTFSFIKKWPICSKCFEFNRLKIKLYHKYIYVMLISSIALVLLSIFLSTQNFLISPNTSLIIMMVSPSFCFIFLPVFNLYLKKEAKSFGLQFSYEPIKLHRLSKEYFAKGYLMQFDCYLLEYALEFYKLNHNMCKIKVSPKLNC